MNNTKDGGGEAVTLSLTTVFIAADFLNAVLPYTDDDRKCLQKHLLKTRNREQLLRIIKTFLADGYCNYEFKERAKWNERK